MTGGGPGIMETANKGAYEAGGYSEGCNIVLPVDQKPNPYLHKWIFIPHFFIWKVILVKYSFAFIVMPVGIGTLDELLEVLTLIQNRMLAGFPVVIFDTEYHKDLCQHIDMMLKHESISPEAVQLLFVTDSVEDLVAHIKKTRHQKVWIKKERIQCPMVICWNLELKKCRQFNFMRYFFIKFTTQISL